jgi:hypothetical protein
MGNKPTKDMAICIAIFNPVKTKRIIMNYFYMVSKLVNYPVYTIELVFGNDKPEIPGSIVVRSNSVMFHKERLFRVLEKKIPRKYTKLAFLDADILFDDSLWYQKASEYLNEYDIVQPFSKCHWLDLTYRTKELTRETAVLMKEHIFSFTYHPGFAWCMKRSWYKKHGFFDYAVSGSGDTLSVAAWMNKKFPLNFKSLPNALKDQYTRFQNMSPPSMTYLDGEVSHLYHGSRKNRQYSDRHKLLELKNDITALTYINSYGVYEWRDLSMNTVFLDYFRTRLDDDLSTEITWVSKTS